MQDPRTLSLWRDRQDRLERRAPRAHYRLPRRQGLAASRGFHGQRPLDVRRLADRTLVGLVVDVDVFQLLIHRGATVGRYVLHELVFLLQIVDVDAAVVMTTIAATARTVEARGLPAIADGHFHFDDRRGVGRATVQVDLAVLSPDDDVVAVVSLGTCVGCGKHRWFTESSICFENFRLV